MEKAVNNLNIKDVAKYIGLSLTTKGLSVSPLKLQKLLYYAQSWFMVLYGRENQLFADVPQAWVNGPVYPVIFYEYKDRTANMCDHLSASDFYDGEPEDGMRLYAGILGLDGDMTESMESIITNYGARTQNELIFLTHSEAPWAEARAGFAPYERSQKEISLDRMAEYYRERYERNRKKA